MKTINVYSQEEFDKINKDEKAIINIFNCSIKIKVSMENSRVYARENSRAEDYR